MGLRTDLHELLCGILGSRNVYFQPPESVKLVYPCIIYNRVNDDSQFADNNPYIYEKRYNITIVDRNPDTDLPDKIAKLNRCVADRFFSTNNLNHYIYNLYY